MGCTGMRRCKILGVHPYQDRLRIAVSISKARLIDCVLRHSYIKNIFKRNSQYQKINKLNTRKHVLFMRKASYTLTNLSQYMRFRSSQQDFRDLLLLTYHKFLSNTFLLGIINDKYFTVLSPISCLDVTQRKEPTNKVKGRSTKEAESFTILH